MNELVVIAIGGNSIITSNEQQSIQHQEKAIKAIVSNIADMLEGGYNIVLTHGNGPQVGLDLRRAEVASQYEDIPIVPLANCVANTQGGIGYQLQQGLVNELTQRGINKQVITLITRVEVAADDINFSNPTKPIGAFFSEQQRDLLCRSIRTGNRRRFGTRLSPRRGVAGAGESIGNRCDYFICWSVASW